MVEEEEELEDYHSNYMSITETPRKVPFGTQKTVIIAIILVRPYNYNWEETVSAKVCYLFPPPPTRNTV